MAGRMLLRMPETDLAHPHAPARPGRASTYDPLSDIVSPRHLQSAVGLSACTCWRLRRRGQFPKPVRLSPGRVGWQRTALQAWLAERAEASR